MAKVLSRLDILLHANTANYVREMKKATDKTKQELKSVADYGKLAGNQLGMAFAGLGSLVSISHIIETADRMQDLASKVRINTQTTEEYNAVLQSVRIGIWVHLLGIAMQQAISQGLSKGFPLGLADMALAVSHGAKIVSAIRSVVMPVGQAHDGIMSVPKSGTWNLEKGERVLPKHTAQNLDNTLNRLQAGGGQVVINQHITINTDGSHDVKDDSQNQMGQALKAGVLAVIQGEMRQGRSIYNFVKNGR